MTASLAGRVALVTGAARGIGRGIALRLAADGAAIAVNDINLPGAQSTVAAIAKSGGRAVACPADIADPNACVQLVTDAARQLGGVDILVNNAGLDLVAPTGDVT
ncbi:MAG TPA: SDR family NAD(P)-dependent oxidoreductase, partial [Gemmatimonadales bacterium]